jgi:hypothetical protein
MLYVWRADRAYIVKYTGRMHKMRLYLCFYYICKLIIRKKYAVERKRRRVRDGREEADRIPEYCEEF